MIFYSKHCAALLMASLCGSSQAANDLVVDWFIPQDGSSSLPSMKAKVGDRAVFNWGGYHNVLIHPSGDCSEDGALDVGEVSGASYTFTESDVGSVAFACDVGRHCEFGQIITFEVSGKSATDGDGDVVSIDSSGGCYDMDVHVCGCDLDACDQTKCEAKGRVWTSQCPTHCDAEVCAAGVVEEPEMPALMNILGELEENGNFGTLLGAIEATGLTDTLKGEGPFTIIAPTDTAFSSITVPSDMDILKSLLLNHVAQEKVTTDGGDGRNVITMIGGEEIEINVDGDKVDVNGSPIKMDYFDVIASNGIIHGVEKVLTFKTDEEEKSASQEDKSSSQEEKSASQEEKSASQEEKSASQEEKDMMADADKGYSSAVSFEVLHYSTLLSAFVACAFIL